VSEEILTGDERGKNVTASSLAAAFIANAAAGIFI